MVTELVYGSKKRTLKELKAVYKNYDHYAEFLGVADLIARIEFLENLVAELQSSKTIKLVHGGLEVVDHGNGD